MGHTYTYRCEHCGYEEYFNQGHGYLVHSQPVKEYLSQRTKLFHYKTHRLLKQLVRKYDQLQMKAGFQVYMCTKCKVLYNKTEVTVFNEEKVVHKSEFRCKDCHTRLKLTNIHRLKRATCPNCHKYSFHIDQMSHSLWN
jgi:Zn finger protein HypA/HybF involved in hydrogenase expression